MDFNDGMNAVLEFISLLIDKKPLTIGSKIYQRKEKV